MFVALIATMIPTLFYTLALWWLDRYEKEPLPLLFAAFFWGSVPAVALTLLFTELLGAPHVLPLVDDLDGPTLLAPLIEEPLKAAALLLLFLFFRHEFDGVLDGIIYGALVGFGFAMSENAIYFLRSKSELSLLIWLRIVLFGLSHAFFTSIVGVAFGLIRYERRRWMGYLVLPGALLLAIFVHSLSNQAVSQQLAGLLLAWMVQSGGVLVLLLVAALSWQHERGWLQDQLREEVGDGLISQREYAIVCSSDLRARAQLRALLQRGWAGFRHERELHHLLSELAFLKHQIKLGDRHCRPADLARLRSRVAHLRLATAVKRVIG